MSMKKLLIQIDLSVNLSDQVQYKLHEQKIVDSSNLWSVFLVAAVVLYNFLAILIPRSDTLQNRFPEIWILVRFVVQHSYIQLLRWRFQENWFFKKKTIFSNTS